jgi:hypothetical protein
MQHAGSEQPGAGQRQERRHDWNGGQRQNRQPPPSSANGHRPGAGTDDLARIRRLIAALLRKAASTTFEHEAEACRAKAEALRQKYGL